MVRLKMAPRREERAGHVAAGTESDRTVRPAGGRDRDGTARAGDPGFPHPGSDAQNRQKRLLAVACTLVAMHAAMHPSFY